MKEFFDEPALAPGRYRGMSGHQSMSSKTEIWLTPPDMITALGPFDMDPCAAPEPRPWPTAAVHYTRVDDGFNRPWGGRIWLNPPYGSPSIIGRWVKRMAEHNCGTALIFARTETDMFHESVWPRASAILFLRGRLHFHHSDGRRAKDNAGAPSCLVAYGEKDAVTLARSVTHNGIFRGAFIDLRLP
jgi:hypothetical protein